MEDTTDEATGKSKEDLAEEAVVHFAAGITMRFKVTDEGEPGWLQVHEPGDPIVVGLGNIGSLITCYGDGEGKTTAMGLSMRQVPNEHSKGPGVLIERDVYDQLADFPVIQDFRFLNVEGAMAVRDVLNVIITNFLEGELGEAGAQEHPEREARDALKLATDHIVGNYGTDGEDDESVGWTGDGVDDQGNALQGGDIPFTFGQVRQLERANRLCQQSGVGPMSRASGTAYRHIVTGGLYTKILEGKWEGDQTPITVYRGEDGQVWMRPTNQFVDGRFEEIR